MQYNDPAICWMLVPDIIKNILDAVADAEIY